MEIIVITYIILSYSIMAGIFAYSAATTGVEDYTGNGLFVLLLAPLTILVIPLLFLEELFDN